MSFSKVKTLKNLQALITMYTCSQFWLPVKHTILSDAGQTFTPCSPNYLFLSLKHILNNTYSRNMSWLRGKETLKWFNEYLSPCLWVRGTFKLFFHTMYLMPKRKRGLDGSKENTVWNKPFFWLFKMKIHLSKHWCTFLFCPRNLTELSIDDEHNLLNGADQTVRSRTNSRRARESPLSKGYYVLTRRVKGKWKQSSESY